MVDNEKDSSFYDLLKRAEVSFVMIKWQRILATEVFKALQCISPHHIQDLFREKDVPYNLRASKIVIQPKCESTRCRTVGHFQFFFYKQSLVVNIVYVFDMLICF